MKRLGLNEVVGVPCSALTVSLDPCEGGGGGELLVITPSAFHVLIIMELTGLPEAFQTLEGLCNVKIKPKACLQR